MSNLLQNREDIISYLNSLGVKGYKINDDLTIDAIGNVNIRSKQLKNLLVKFNLVHGDFDCSMNLLTSLEGCPNIVLGNFECGGNQLKSLVNGPRLVGKNYSCILNPIENLDDFSTDFRRSFKHSSHFSERIKMLEHLYQPGIGNQDIWKIAINFQDLKSIREIDKLKKEIDSELKINIPTNTNKKSKL